MFDAASEIIASSPFVENLDVFQGRIGRDTFGLRRKASRYRGHCVVARWGGLCLVVLYQRRSYPLPEKSRSVWSHLQCSRSWLMRLRPERVKCFRAAWRQHCPSQPLLARARSTVQSAACSRISVIKQARQVHRSTWTVAARAIREISSVFEHTTNRQVD